MENERNVPFIDKMQEFTGDNIGCLSLMLIVVALGVLLYWVC